MNTSIQSRLLALAEEQYRRFSASLMPTVDVRTVIGVRIPHIRRLAAQLSAKEASEFLSQLPHSYYEENNLHAFLIAGMRDFDACTEALECFLPYVDNWATCDSLRPVCFAKSKARLLERIDRWLDSPHPYTVRFGIEMLMVHFLDAEFDPAQAARVASVSASDYYVRMMVAWYFATALAKQYDTAIVYLQQHCLAPWVEKKTIQKAIESDRISDAQKQYLRLLRANPAPN